MQSCMMMLSSGNAAFGAVSGCPVSLWGAATRALTLSITPIIIAPAQERRIPADVRTRVKENLVNDSSCQIVNNAEHFRKPSRY
jgi:hypothetical protein